MDFFNLLCHIFISALLIVTNPKENGIQSPEKQRKHQCVLKMQKMQESVYGKGRNSNRKNRNSNKDGRYLFGTPCEKRVASLGSVKVRQFALDPEKQQNGSHSNGLA